MESAEDDQVVHRKMNQTSNKVLDLSDGGGELPKEFIAQWNRLSADGRKAFQDYLQHMSLFDAGTVQVNAGQAEDGSLNLKWGRKEKETNISAFAHLAPETANTVRKVDRGKRDAQIEAVLEGIEFIHKRNLPRGIILSQDNLTQSPVTTKQEVKGCDKMVEVLGKGNSAGEITVFKDSKTGQEMALKTVMISQFNPDEIRLWVQLGDVNMAPELYHFELVENRLYFTMEIMSGKDLQDVIDQDMWSIPDLALVRDFSLCILHDLLEIWEEMRSRAFVHADMHAGNLRLEKSMQVKIFDFGRAKHILGEKGPDAERLIKQDIVGIIRVFCALYSGFDFNDYFEALKVLEAKNLKELDEMMIRLSEDNRKELYHIITMLFDTVRGNNPVSPGSFGNTKNVASHVKSLLSSADMMEIKKKAAVIIFPERFQNKGESEPVSGSSGRDMVDAREGRNPHPDLDPIWDDPDMEEFVSNVSETDVIELSASQ